jgi:uncharacterized protein (TIRG00374 family)
VLLVSLRHVGVGDAEVSWAEVLAVFAFARLATIIPFTPGGAGVVELVLIGGLTAAGGDREQVTAAVLVYRALTWRLPILVGVACYVWWHQSRLRPSPFTTGGRQMPMPKGKGTGNLTGPAPRREEARGAPRVEP